MNTQPGDVVHGATVRLRQAQQKLHDGKRALRDWMAEQENQLNEEEKHIRLIEEAIDVETTDDEFLLEEKSEIDDRLTALCDEAERLLSETQKD